MNQHLSLPGVVLLTRGAMTALLLTVAMFVAPRLSVAAEIQLAQAPEAEESPAAEAENPEAAKLLEEIDTLEKAKIDGTTREEQIGAAQKSRQQIATLATKVLATPGLSEEQRMRAIKAKMYALMILVRTEAPGAMEAFKKFNTELASDKNETVAKHARQQLLMVKLAELHEGKTADVDGLAADIKKSLTQPGAGEGELDLARNVLHTLESLGFYSQAQELYAVLGVAFRENENPALAKMAADTSATGMRRLSNLNKTLDIKGSLLNGQQFDLASLKGKVVLVDFWATWCGPCMAEMPKLKKLYAEYHDRGFEIVGVSLDEDLKLLESTVEKTGITWPIIFSREPGSQGFEGDPLVKQLGIDSVPATFLIDRDGKVIDIGLRGEKLDKKIAQLFAK